MAKKTGKKAAQKKKAKRKSDEAKILENRLITMLGLAKVPVRKIREDRRRRHESSQQDYTTT